MQSRDLTKRGDVWRIATAWPWRRRRSQAQLAICSGLLQRSRDTARNSVGSNATSGCGFVTPRGMEADVGATIGSGHET